MKKALLSFAAALLLHTGFSQCTPSLTVANGPGYYPPPPASLANATEGLPYTDTIQIKVAADTTTGLGTFPINHIRIDSITGLPPGITYSVTPSNDTIQGGMTGCILFSGTPAMGSDTLGPNNDGNFPFIIHTTWKVVIFSIPTDFSISQPGYDIQVLPSTLGNPEEAALQFSLYPNPATDVLKIVSGTTIENLSLYSATGQLIREIPAVQQKEMTVSLEGTAPGVYIVKAVMEDGSLQQHKCIVQPFSGE